MTNAWMLCCRAALSALIALAAAGAQAHKASDAYLQLHADTSAASLRVDVALRDLDVALDLDADGDGRLTWGEVRHAWPAIETYLRQHVEVAGCAWSAPVQALEKRVDGVYAALTWHGACGGGVEPVIRYTLLHDVDPTHRGIARIEGTARGTVLRVLDPTRPATLPASDVDTAEAKRDAAPQTDAEPATASSEVRLGNAPSASPAPSPSDVAPADAPRATQFLTEGIAHILTGYDHVLFLLCLLLPAVMRRGEGGWRPVERLGQALWPVFGIVSAFTLAHSLTLGLAASRLVALSPGVIEPAIAVTIVLAALDNLVPIFGGRRALVTFAFGLIHGFGFAGVLAELNLAPSQFAWALLQFNLGLELGQLMIVAAAVAVLFLLRVRPRYPQWVIRGGSLAAIAIGVLWFIERTANVALLPL
jgi:hypothetical protein